MGRLFAIILFLAVLSAGCSSNNAGREKPGELYEQDQLGQFVEDTDPLESEEDYVIGIGDRLDVVFFVHKELTTIDLLVRSDGRITLPYVGDVDAAGVTPMQLDSTLTLPVLRSSEGPESVRDRHGSRRTSSSTFSDR